MRRNLDRICRTAWLLTRGGPGGPVTLFWRPAQGRRETREGHVFVPVENWKLLLPREEGRLMSWRTHNRALCSTDQGGSTTCTYRHQRPHQAMQKGAHVVGRDSPTFRATPLEPGQGPGPVRHGAPITGSSHDPSSTSTALLQHHWGPQISPKDPCRLIPDPKGELCDVPSTC